jgi:signal transduction histidine kinase
MVLVVGIMMDHTLKGRSPMHHNDRTIQMSDRTFCASSALAWAPDFMNLLWNHLRRLLALSAHALAVVGAVAEQPASFTQLTNCAAVRALPREVAVQKLPVRITGVVSYREAFRQGGSSAFVLHDGDEGVCCNLSRNLNKRLVDMQAGDKVEVVGVSGPGFTSLVEVNSVRRLGRGVLPPSSPSELWQVQNGRYDCALISLEGVVRRMHKDGHGCYRLEISEKTGTFSAFVPAEQGELPDSLVDARLRLEGTCFTLFNPRGESTGVNLRLAGPGQLTILEHGPADPFAAPLASPLALNAFRPGPEVLHRRRVVGTVTLHRQGEFFYLQCEQRTFRIHSRQKDALAVGDVVEASGFVEQTPHFAVLAESVFRIRGRAEVPVPRRVTLNELMSVPPGGRPLLQIEDYDGMLITIQASFIKSDHDEHGWHRLHVAHDGVVSHAILGPDVAEEHVAGLTPGSLLDLSGVCELRLVQGWPTREMPKPASFILHLQDQNAIRLIAAPSWWTVQRLTWALYGIALVTLAILLWNIVLRRTVRMQTEAIAERITQESRLQERQRIGRDLHDTLHQELTGIGMLIGSTRDNITDPPKALTTLHMAERMVHRASVESRGTIQDLMSVALTEQGLQTALEESVKPLAQLGGAVFQIDVDPALPRLGPRIETALLRIAHEAAANAGRHSKAREVFLSLGSTPSHVIMELRDDGCGFDPNIIRGGDQRHFGLLSMEQRARKLNGWLEITSAPGTTVRVTLPLSPS